MKILFAWVFKINPLNGGVERVSSIVMDGLRSRGYQCNNIICENDNHDFYLNNEVKDDNHLSLERLKTYLEEQQYDVIVCQDGNSISMTKVFRENCSQSTKVVTCLHSDPAMWECVFSLNNVLSEIKRSRSFKTRLFWFIRLLMHPLWKKRALKGIGNIYKTNYSYCNKYVLLSSKFFPAMNRYMRIQTSEKLYEIGNPLSFKEIATPEILNKKRKEVLIVSRLDETQKKISFALKVWQTVQKKEIKDWTLRIVGNGPDEDYLKKIAKSQQIGNISFEGKQMPVRYYETSSIFMMTSDFEGWGVTLTEAQQLGVVPIARDSYLSLHDIITDGYDGCIIKNNDINSYAAKLIWLMTNEDKRKQIALNGLESARRFTIDKITDQWEAMIESL